MQYTFKYCYCVPDDIYYIIWLDTSIPFIFFYLRGSKNLVRLSDHDRDYFIIYRGHLGMRDALDNLIAGKVEVELTYESLLDKFKYYNNLSM